MGIEIREYDPEWPRLAAAVIEEIVEALPGLIVEAEHLGSTSVPGMAAKPVIDVMVAVGELGVVEQRETVVEALGYRRVDVGMPERLFYRRVRDGELVVHLHVVTVDSWGTRNERLLRDHLRGHAADRLAYGRLKRELAEAGHDADAYTRGKTALIQRMVDDARAARGLPRVDVWEG
ncbi:GrpB family protein [Actinoplanes sp. NPDC000266]